MKDNYDFSKLKNVRKNPFAERLNREGHITIIHTSPQDLDDDFDEEINEDLKKEAI
jgi:hypothetical protein